MNPRIADDDEIKKAQNALAPFLRPTVRNDDPSWKLIEEMSWEEKFDLIRGTNNSVATNDQASVNAPPLNQNALNGIRKRSHAFGNEMLAQFEAYVENGDIDEAYYYAAVNFLAFNKWSDLDALEQVKNNNYNGSVKYQSICAAAMSAAWSAGGLRVATGAYALESPEIEIRLLPYDFVIFLFINEPSDSIPEELLFGETNFAVFHEVGHHIYWRGIADVVNSFEAWSRTMLGGLNQPSETNAYLAFEEYFCDGVGIALGGEFGARALIFRIVESSQTLRSGGYGRNRLIALLRGYKALYGEYESLLDYTNEHMPTAIPRIQPAEVDAPVGHVYALLNDTTVTSFLDNLRDESLKVTPLARLRDWRAINSEILPLITETDPATRRSLIHEAWLARTGSVDSAGYTYGQLPGTISSRPQVEYPSPRGIIDDIIARMQRVPSLQRFPQEWFAVLQADGWGNRPTKNNIGTQR